MNYGSGVPAGNKTKSADTTMIAMASVNYLFGETPSPKHEHLDLQRIHTNAIQRLRDDALLRELVVQSLRVATVLSYVKTGVATVQGEDIVTMFGAEYPIAPNPDNYERLVEGVVATLSPEMQAEIRSRFGLV